MTQTPGPQDPEDRVGGTGPQPPASARPLPPEEERTWTMLAHLGGIVLFWVAPLVIWLIFRERSQKVDREGKEALNFQITLFLGYIAGSVTTVIGIGYLIGLATWICAVVFGVMAAMATSRGEDYRYPFAIRLIT